MEYDNPKYWMVETCVYVYTYMYICIHVYIYMGVSINGGSTKSSMSIGSSLINHPFWGTPIYGKPHINHCNQCHHQTTEATGG